MREKGHFIKDWKQSFQTKKFKGGAYLTAVTILVIGVILCVNLIISKLDIKFDLSSENLYSLSDVTKDYIKDLEDDITIYYLAKTGQANETYSKIVELYENYSKNIKVEYKDPIQYPKFALEYTDESLSADSVIIVNHTNGRAKYVSSSEYPIYEFDYSTYQQYEAGLNVEGAITQGITYVTKEELPKIYEVEGHGETPLGNTLGESLQRMNMETATLNTLTTESIPEDCDVLLINAPQNDYSVDEITMIKEYLVDGGKATIFVDHSVMKLDNFADLLEYYGVEVADGIVIEGNRNNYVGQYVNYLLPNIDGHDITSSLKVDKKYVVVPESKGILTLDSKRSSVTITSLLTTSEDAFSKVDLQDTTITKSDKDIKGPFSIAVEITETYNDKVTNLVVYGSPYMISDDIVANNSAYGNQDIFLNSMRYLTGDEDSISVPAKTRTQEYITLTASQSMYIAIAVVIILPVFILGTGGYICFTRRRK